MRIVWTKNHWSNRIRDDGPAGTITVEQVWRVTVQHGDEPPETKDYSSEELAQFRADFLRAKLGGTWERTDRQG